MKIGSIVLAVVAFGFGVKQYGDSQDEKAKAEIATSKRPFLDTQLALYQDATRSVATIASSPDPAVVAKATERFHQLYWGELAMVEDLEVEDAMGRFQRALSQNAANAALEQCSLRLAHVVRGSLARSWGADVWKSHYDQITPSCDF